MIEKVKNKKILITGGLGMIGSTLTHKLVNLGAKVTLVDPLIQPFGGNLFNIKDVEKLVNVNISDIRDKESIKVLVQDKDIVFNLAGQVSHNDSLKDPYLDADINYIGHLNVLEAVKNHNPTAKVLYSGSRLQFGKIFNKPGTEGAFKQATFAFRNEALEEMSEELAQDVLEIITVFSARLYGSRSRKNQKLVEAAKVLME